MAKVVFTPNVQRHVACPEADAPGCTVREVLDNVFAGNPQARGYVLDDQSALRRHISRALLAFLLRWLRRRNNVTAGMGARDICMRAAALDRARVAPLGRCRVAARPRARVYTLHGR